MSFVFHEHTFRETARRPAPSPAGRAYAENTSCQGRNTVS